MTGGLRNVTQGERLRELGLFNLERHRHREGLSLELCDGQEDILCVCRILRKQQRQFRLDRRENFLLVQMSPLRSSLGERVTSVNSRGQLRDSIQKFTEDVRCIFSFRTGLGQMKSWELLLSCCYVLKCSSCELHFSQVASVLHGLLPKVCDGLTGKATYRQSGNTKCVHMHAAFRASLWPPGLGSLLTMDIWDMASTLPSVSFADN